MLFAGLYKYQNDYNLPRTLKTLQIYLIHNEMFSCTHLIYKIYIYIYIYVYIYMQRQIYQCFPTESVTD